MTPTLSVILVNYNERDHLRRALRLLAGEFPERTEIIVVDNNSADGSAAMVRTEFPNIQLIASGANLMYGQGNNLGMERSRGQWLLVLNPDVEWAPGQLHKFTVAAKGLANLGVAGPRIIEPNGRLQRTAHHHWPSWRTIFVDYCLPLQQYWLRQPRHPYLDSVADHGRTHQVAHLTGVCLMLSRETFMASGGFDPEFTMYLEETEWQRRLSDSGRQQWFVAEAEIIHFGSAQKSFAQANRHYLWGLWHYVDRHWTGLLRHWRLLGAIWAATLISDICLIIFWPASWLLAGPGRRWRHYTRQYLRLTRNLLSYPTKAPPVS